MLKIKNIFSPFIEISAKDYAEYTYLNNFYKRYNKVQLDKIAIEKQKE